MEKETPYFNDLKDSLNKNSGSLQQMERYRMNEIVEACRQSGIEFEPEYNREN